MYLTARRSGRFAIDGCNYIVLNAAAGGDSAAAFLVEGGERGRPAPRRYGRRIWWLHGIMGAWRFAGCDPFRTPNHPAPIPAGRRAGSYPALMFYLGWRVRGSDEAREIEFMGGFLGLLGGVWEGEMFVGMAWGF